LNRKTRGEGKLTLYTKAGGVIAVKIDNDIVEEKSIVLKIILEGITGNG
jgi:hypothetical protein